MKTPSDASLLAKHQWKTGREKRSSVAPANADVGTRNRVPNNCSPASFYRFYLSRPMFCRTDYCANSLEGVLVFHVTAVLLRALRKCFEKSSAHVTVWLPSLKYAHRLQRGGACLSRQTPLLRANHMRIPREPTKCSARGHFPR